ncbi:SLATT domain-containing protein [Crenalkalicoccus roseus]|uniref:SLATT domain-containing protein n=1 Tax=Crenalkalicoccus roseus TaxID=1485588 RepID=UPI00108196BE|nr:SLATT domain-containing protein [Crenalkalicoccus roseus]
MQDTTRTAGLPAEAAAHGAGGEGERKLLALPGGMGAGEERVPDRAPEAWLARARAEAAEIEYECRFHARAQFEACAVWERRSTYLGIVMAVLGALTAGTIATAFADSGLAAQGADLAAQGQAGGSGLTLWMRRALAIGALIAGVVAAAVRFLDPSGRAGLHGAAGKRYTALADEARQFRNLVATAEADRADLIGRLQGMAKRRAEIHEAAPVIPAGAMAQTRGAAEADHGLRLLAVEAGRRPAS